MAEVNILRCRQTKPVCMMKSISSVRNETVKSQDSFQTYRNPLDAPKYPGLFFSSRCGHLAKKNLWFCPQAIYCNIFVAFQCWTPLLVWQFDIFDTYSCLGLSKSSLFGIRTCPKQTEMDPFGDKYTETYVMSTEHDQDPAAAFFAQKRDPAGLEDDDSNKLGDMSVSARRQCFHCKFRWERDGVLQGPIMLEP